MTSLSQERLMLLTTRLQAMGEPTRLRILEVLGRAEQPAGRIADVLGSQQSTISKHLQILFRAGLVHRRREASTVIYSVADEEVLTVLRYLSSPRLSGRSAVLR